MAVHGLKVNNKELQRFLDNYLSRQVTKITSAGKSAMQEISKNAIVDWYNRANPNHSYSSILSSVRINSSPIRQNSNKVWIDINMNIDGSLYSYYTSHYNIYHYSNSSKINDPIALTFGAQWENGIIGLPPYDRNGKSWPHIDAGGGLKGYIVDAIDYKWKKMVKKYL